MKRQCDCRHEYQDKAYGKSVRLHTEGKSKITCTVCGKVTKT